MFLNLDPVILIMEFRGIVLMVPGDTAHWSKTKHLTFEAGL